MKIKTLIKSKSPIIQLQPTGGDQGVSSTHQVGVPGIPPCIRGQSPCRELQEGELCLVQGHGSQHSCHIADWGPSPSLAWTADRTAGWQLPMIPARSTPCGIPYLENPSRGAGAGAAMHSHLCCYLQSCLGSTIFLRQGLREVENAQNSLSNLFFKKFSLAGTGSLELVPRRSWFCCCCHCCFLMAWECERHFKN